MNFALIGLGPLTLPLASAIGNHAEHQLSYLICQDPSDHSLPRQIPGLQIDPDWETLLQGAYDLVIVTGSSVEDLHAARSLYAQRQPLALCPQYCMQAEFIYELSLIQDDNQVLLVPLLPCLWRGEVLSIMQEFEQQTVLNLNWERTLPQVWLEDSLAAEQQNLINEWLLHDLMLLRKLGGAYNQVSAMRTLNTARKSDNNNVDAAEQISHLSVTLSGTDLPPVCWTLRQADVLRAELTYTTAEKNSSIVMTEPNYNQTSSPAVPDSLIDQLTAQELLNRIVSSALSKSADPDLRELTRGFETVDAVQRSIKRRRSVDLYFETTSERSQFKSQMTAIGCGVLLLTPVLMVVRLMLGVMLPEQQLLLKLTGGLVFAPLFLFLLFQLLIFFAQPSGNRQ